MKIKLWNEMVKEEKLKTPILKLERCDGGLNIIELNVVDDNGEHVGSLFRIYYGKIIRTINAKSHLERAGYDTSCFQWTDDGKILNADDTPF